jgi:hypothetical protein
MSRGNEQTNPSMFYVSNGRRGSDRSDHSLESLGRCMKETDCMLACEIDPSNGSADKAENSKRILYTSKPVQSTECTYYISLA